jgi:DNA-binding transcriptional LysR family regulator
VNDGPPPLFHSEKLYREEWICAVVRNSSFGDKLSLKQHLGAHHIVVATLPGIQAIPDKQLAALGGQRRSFVRLPYFGVALQCLSGTDLVLTLTSGMRPVVPFHLAAVQALWRWPFLERTWPNRSLALTENGQRPTNENPQ